MEEIYFEFINSKTNIQIMSTTGQFPPENRMAAAGRVENNNGRSQYYNNTNTQ